MLIFLDTNPFIAEYYKNKEYGPNVKGQDTVKQKRWLEQQLKNTPASVKWKIVVAHHPVFTGGSRTEGYDTRAIRNSILPVLEKYKADIYLAGHEHSLQHIYHGGALHHIISGAASEKTPARLIAGSKFAASTYGFFTFSITPHEAILQAVDDTGKIIYTTAIKK